MHHTHTSSQLWPDYDTQCIAYVRYFYRSRKIEHYDTRVLLERIKKGARIPHFIFFSAFFRFGERKKKNRPSVLSGFIYAHTGTKNRRNAHTHIGRMGAKKMMTKYFKNLCIFDIDYTFI